MILNRISKADMNMFKKYEILPSCSEYMLYFPSVTHFLHTCQINTLNFNSLDIELIQSLVAVTVTLV